LLDSLLQEFKMSDSDPDEEFEWPEDPEDFFDKKWPHPKLIENRAVGPDLALVFWMDWFGVDAQRTKKRFRFVRVKVTAKYRCHKCNKPWTSRHGWVKFDMKNQQVERQFGQKCRDCKDFYSRPFPFFYVHPHGGRETDPNKDSPRSWRDIVIKAIDLFMKNQYFFHNTDEGEGSGGKPPQDDQNEPFGVDPGSGPHEMELCEMCRYLQRPCWGRNYHRPLDENSDRLQ